MVQQFYNRKEELKFLRERYESPGKNLVVIYGRRRIGKTMLLKQFCDETEGIYHLATATTLEANVENLKSKLFERFGDKTFLSINSKFLPVLEYLVRVLKNRKLVIAIDEFPYLVDVSRTIISDFQKLVDDVIDGSNIFLILSGSSIGMMENDVLGYSSPLYGRRTGSILVEEFNFEDILYFYGNDFSSILEAFSVFGSVPFYLSMIDRDKSILKNVADKILTKSSMLYVEPDFLLRQELRESRVYEMILESIGRGRVTLNEISQDARLERSNVSKYIYILSKLRLLEHVVPYGSKRNGIYGFKDNFLNFYFRFVFPHRDLVETGNSSVLLENIEKQLNTYYGRMFEQAMLSMISRRIIQLGFPFDSVKRYWRKGVEIDCILVDSKSNTLSFAEFKWSDKVDSVRVLNDLKRKANDSGLITPGSNFIIVAKTFSTRTDDAVLIDLTYLDKIVMQTHQKNSQRA